MSSTLTGSLPFTFGSYDSTKSNPFTETTTRNAYSPPPSPQTLHVDTGSSPNFFRTPQKKPTSQSLPAPAAGVYFVSYSPTTACPNESYIKSEHEFIENFLDLAKGNTDATEQNLQLLLNYMRHSHSRQKLDHLTKRLIRRIDREYSPEKNLNFNMLLAFTEKLFQPNSKFDNIRSKIYFLNSLKKLQQHNTEINQIEDFRFPKKHLDQIAKLCDQQIINNLHELDFNQINNLKPILSPYQLLYKGLNNGTLFSCETKEKYVTKIEKLKDLLKTIQAAAISDYEKILVIETILNKEFKKSPNQVDNIYQFITEQKKLRSPLQDIAVELIESATSDNENLEAFELLKTIHVFISALQNHMYPLNKKELQYTALLTQITFIQKDIIERFFQVKYSKDGVIFNPTDAKGTWQKSIHTLHQTHKGIKRRKKTKTSPQSLYQTKEGVAAHTSMNVANDMTTLAPDINELIDGSRGNYEVQSEFVGGLNFAAGMIATAWRHIGKNKNILTSNQIKLDKKLAAIALKNLAENDKNQIFYQGSKSYHLAKKFKIEGYQNIIPQERSEIHKFNPEMEIKDIFLNFLNSKKDALNAENVKNLILELKKKYKQNDRLLLHHLNFLVFKNKKEKFRGNFFQHLCYLNRKNDSEVNEIKKLFKALFCKLYPLNINLSESEINLTEGIEITPQNESEEPETITKEQLQNLQNIKIYINADYGAIEQFFQSFIYGISQDRERCSQKLHAFDFVISLNNNLTDQQRYEFFSRLEHFKSLGINGEGPLAELFIKRNALFSEAAISTAGYESFSLKHFVGAANPEIITGHTASVVENGGLLGGAKWIGASLMFPLYEYFSFGKTTASNSFFHIVHQRKSEYKRKILNSQENRDLILNTDRNYENPGYFSQKEFIQKIHDKKIEISSLDDVLTFKNGQKFTVNQCLKSLKDNLFRHSTNCFPSFLESYHQKKTPLLLKLLEKLEKEEGKKLLLNYYYNHSDMNNVINETYTKIISTGERTSQSNNDLRNVRLQSNSLDFLERISDVEKFRCLLRKLTDTVSKEKLTFNFLKLECYIRTNYMDENSVPLENYKEIKEKCVQILAEHYHKNKVIKKETLNKMVLKKLFIRALGAAQWGAISAIISGITISKVYGVTVIVAGISGASFSLGVIPVLGIAFVMFGSCAIRWWTYKQGDFLSYSEHTESNQFILKRLQQEELKAKIPAQYIAPNLKNIFIKTISATTVVYLAGAASLLTGGVVPIVAAGFLLIGYTGYSRITRYYSNKASDDSNYKPGPMTPYFIYLHPTKVVRNQIKELNSLDAFNNYDLREKVLDLDVQKNNITDPRVDILNNSENSPLAIQHKTVDSMFYHFTNTSCAFSISSSEKEEFFLNIFKFVTVLLQSKIHLSVKVDFIQFILKQLDDKNSHIYKTICSNEYHEEIDDTFLASLLAGGTAGVGAAISMITGLCFVDSALSTHVLMDTLSGVLQIGGDIFASRTNSAIMHKFVKKGKSYYILSEFLQKTLDLLLNRQPEITTRPINIPNSFIHNDLNEPLLASASFSQSQPRDFSFLKPFSPETGLLF